MFNRIALQYQDSTAVVIGAGGIGSGIAQLLAPHVKNLVIADRDQDALTRIAAVYSSREINTQPLDVQNAQSVRDFFAHVEAVIGTPDYLFYTAGILNVESLAELSTDLWDRTVSVNLSGAFYCVQAVAESMRKKKRGSILLLGSIAGTKARSGSRVNPVYNATKAGLSGFVNGAAIQLRPFGVRINCISPGPTATSMMDLQPASVHASVAEIALDGRMNAPAEVAELALFVAGHGRFTGEDIGLGGGTGLGG